MKAIYVLAAVAAALFFLLTACGSAQDDDEDAGGGEGDAADDDTTGDEEDPSGEEDDPIAIEADTYTDPDSGVTWLLVQRNYLDWNEADSFCSRVVAGGYDDWRLPTVAELRSLVRGCAGTEPGGECGVTTGCQDAALDSSLGCWDSACSGCGVGGGPGVSGCYWPEEMGGTCGWVWSASQLTDELFFKWVLDFQSAGLGGMDEAYDDAVSTRCVR